MRVNARNVRKNGLQLRPEGGKEVATRLPKVTLMMNTTTVHVAGQKPPVIAYTSFKKGTSTYQKKYKKKNFKGVLFWSLGA